MLSACICLLGNEQFFSYRGRFMAQKPESALRRVQIPRRFLVRKKKKINFIFEIYKIIYIFKSSISQHNQPWLVSSSWLTLRKVTGFRWSAPLQRLNHIYTRITTVRYFNGRWIENKQWRVKAGLQGTWIIRDNLLVATLYFLQPFYLFLWETNSRMWLNRVGFLNKLN